MARLGLPARTGLAPRWRDRITHALRPGWTRTVLIRRVLAIALLLLAAGIGLAGHRTGGDRPVVVATHDLLPGNSLGAADVRVDMVPASLLPDGAIVATGDGIGRTVAGRVRAGEFITDARLITPQLAAALTGRQDARLVPVRLADEALTALLRSGDVVDVLSPDAEVLARSAVVALPAGEAGARGVTSRATTRPVLLAMGEASAHRVAAAGLDAALAVVLH